MPAVFAGCGEASVAPSLATDVPTVMTPFDGGAPEASAVVEAAPPDAPTVLVTQGSPLCNASRSTGCCYPDDPDTATPLACAQAACQMPSDGGAPDASTLFAVSLGCHVPSGSMAPTTASSSGAATSPAPGGAPAGGTVCQPSGLGLDGVLCDGPGDCAASYECVVIGTQGVCRHYCCAGNASCAIGQFCDIQTAKPAPGASVPVCVPIQPCRILAPGWCADGQTCAVVDELGDTSCVAVGNQGPGQSCEKEHCSAGLVCLGSMGERTCDVLCHTAKGAECAAGQTCKGGYPLFPDPDVGICQ